MKIAIISDIHANLEALTAVMSDICLMGVDKIVCLGDVIGYGTNPNECVEIVQRECDFCLIGNHETAVFDDSISMEFNENARVAIRWTRENLNRNSVDYINTLFMTQVFDGIFTGVHSTPYEPHLWHYISSVDDALFNFNFFKTKFCLIGHTHVPGVIVLRGESDVSASQTDRFNYEDNFCKDAKFIVNVGSVGQPRDKNCKACYVIADTVKKEMYFMRVPYDIASYQRKMRDAKMPESLILRVANGA